MPELPEVETTCRGIRPHIEDQTISHVDVHNGSLRWPIPDEIYNLKLQKITAVTRRAKYILLEIDHSSHLILHLGMSGNLRIEHQDSPLKKHDHLVLHFTNGLQMRLNDPRRFGCALYHSGPIETHPLLKKLGPEPLSNDFSAEKLYLDCRNRARPIKSQIMDNSTVVGVGNIYACESLFLSSIHPSRPANKISKARITALHDSIRSVLTSAIAQGGTTLKDFLNSDGKPGYFQQQLNVYGREAQPCHHCSTPIKRITLGQRSTFYCPKCQR